MEGRYKYKSLGVGRADELKKLDDIPGYVPLTFIDRLAKFGASEWDSDFGYEAPCMVYGSNGLFYSCISDSGPSTTPKDPVKTEGYWEVLDVEN